MCEACIAIIEDTDPKIINTLEKYSAELLNLFIKIDAEIGNDIIEFKDDGNKVENDVLLRRQIITGVFATTYLHNMLPVEDESLVVDMVNYYATQGLRIGHAINYVNRNKGN